MEFDGTPVGRRGVPPLAMVYGGGGVFGIGYSAGVARTRRTEASRWPPRPPSAPRPAPGRRHRSRSVSPTTRWQPSSRRPSPTCGPGCWPASPARSSARRPIRSCRCRPCACSSGRRHILDGGRFPLADLVAASSAVPGLLAPHRVGGRSLRRRWDVVDDVGRRRRPRRVGHRDGPAGRPARRAHRAAARGSCSNASCGRGGRRHPDRLITMIRPNGRWPGSVGRTPLSLFDGLRPGPSTRWPTSRASAGRSACG